MEREPNVSKKNTGIFDPVSMKFIDPKTTIGKKVKKYNQLCEKCDPQKILNPDTNRCVSITGKYKDILADNIDYCNKYRSHKINVNKSTSSGKKIIDNILNIKIPKDFFKDKKEVKIKDIFNENKLKTDFSLASKLNVKDQQYKKYINYIPVLLFTIFQVISINPEISSFLINVLTQILARFNNNFVATCIKICTEYIYSPFLIKVISSISLSKFLVFISGLIMTITNLPSMFRNRHVVSKISETVLTGKNVPYQLNKNDFKISLIDIKKPVNLSEIEKISIEKFNAYNPITKTVSLSKLGLNTGQVSDKDTRLIFSYDDINNLPFAEIVKNNRRLTSVFLFPDKDKITKIKELNADTSNLIKFFKDETSKLLNTRETYQKYASSVKLEQEIKDLKSNIENFRKGTPVFNKKSHQITIKSTELNKIKKVLDELNYTPISDQERSLIQPRLKISKEWETNLLNFRKDLEKIDKTNFNFHFPNLKSFLDSATNTVKSINNVQINTHSSIPSSSIPLNNPRVDMTNSNIKKNFNIINSEITQEAKNEVDSMFKNILKDVQIEEEEVNKKPGIIEMLKQKNKIKNEQVDDILDSYLTREIKNESLDTYLTRKPSLQKTNKTLDDYLKEGLSLKKNNEKKQKIKVLNDEDF